MSVEAKVLDLFKVMVVDDVQLLSSEYKDELSVSLASHGVILNFIPTANQTKILKDHFKPLDLRTLFSVQERANADPVQLIAKQLIHYYEVYGINQPGLFNLEFEDGKIVPATFIKGVDASSLAVLVRNILYANAPVKDAQAIVDIIRPYSIEYDINNVANNELRVMLFNTTTDSFLSGDDFVRWVCWKATSSPLLIKDKKTVAAVKAQGNISPDLLEKHKFTLARVFHRHKPLILAMKNAETAPIINQIRRLAKNHHKPLPPAANKTFVADALAGRIEINHKTCEQFSMRDLLKFLNSLEESKANLKSRSFIIRNGRVWTQDNTQKATDEFRAERAITNVLTEIRTRLLKHLDGKTILVDSNVTYGLPISRKQAVGNLPFGTQVRVDRSQKISSGIYWEGVGVDLDLSTIDLDGTRTGWGAGRGYTGKDIVFSGDVTTAANGAMEFMTSTNQTYGLFVNVFRGDLPQEMSLVVGDQAKGKWIDNCLIKESHKLESRGNLLGFVEDDKFIVYAGRLNSNQISSPRDTAIVEKSKVEYWTIEALLDVCGITYDEPMRKKDVDYDYDLTYNGFTWEKLENLLGI